MQENKKNKKINVKPMVSKSIDGKLPPQAIDLEEAVLGALMIDNDALSNAIELLKSESFYKYQHQKIFSAIEDLFNSAKKVDILTIVEELKKKGELKEIGPSFVKLRNVSPLLPTERTLELLPRFIQRVNCILSQNKDAMTILLMF